ncbi:hypothetical protein [Cryptosporangium sp. NPDC051539]
MDFSDLTEALNQQMSAADAFLTGRRTFEDMRSFWRRAHQPQESHR